MGKQRAHREQIIDGTAKILSEEEAKEEKKMNDEQNQTPENKIPAETKDTKKHPVKERWDNLPKPVKTGAKVAGGLLAAALVGLITWSIFGKGNSDDSDGFDQDPIGLPFDEPDDTVSFDDFSVEEKPESETENVEE